MKDLVEGIERSLQVKQHLSHLIVRQLVGDGHVIQGLQPLANFLFALKVAGQDAQSVHRVHEISQIGVQLVHLLDVQSQLVHERDGQGNDIGYALGRVALVVFYRYRAILLYSLEGRWTIQTECTRECVNRWKLVALYLQISLL